MEEAGVGDRTRKRNSVAVLDQLPPPAMDVTPVATPGLESPGNDSLAADLDAAITASASSSPRSLASTSPLLLARNSSFSSVNTPYLEEAEYFQPVDRITPFDLLSQIQLQGQLEKWQATLSMQKDRVRKQRQKLKETGITAKDRVVEEWRRRVATPDEQLDKYRRRMRHSVERLGKQWNDTRSVTAREKASFIAGVLNIFISGYIIGAFPEQFYLWFTAQFFYFMPIRYYTYHARGYHYFLADLCYFVNALLLLSLWVFPHSKRLLISTYCLAYGNNAIAIAMWRNSLVFHSLDKVTRYLR